MMRRWRRKTRDAGFALLLVIWVLALIVVMATEFAYSMRTEIKIAINYRDEVQAYYLAWAGVQAAMYEIGLPYTGNLIGEGGQVIFVRPNTALPEMGQAGYMVEDELAPRVPQRSGLTLGNGYFSYTIEDEDGKFNLNSLVTGQRIRQDNVERFRQLLVACGVEAGVTADIIIDSILDWMDSDDLHRMNGAEDEYYEDSYAEQGQSAPYHAKNGEFSTLEELLLVQGMTPEVYYGSGNVPQTSAMDQMGEDDWEMDEGAYLGIAQFLTVFSLNKHVTRINQDTASPFLLNVLFPERAESMMENREDFGRTSGRQRASTTFTIQATGYLKSSSVSRTIRAVVRRHNSRRAGGIQVVFWKDNAKFQEPSGDKGFEEWTEGSIIQTETVG